MSPPQINTYHCTFCTNLLLATTHTLSKLPVRRGEDGSLILPVRGVEGDRRGEMVDGRGEEEEEMMDGGEREEGKERDLPSYGVTILVSLIKPAKGARVVVRRVDGFEVRGVWRCGRCGVGVGYVVEGDEQGKGEGEGEGDGMVLYLFRGGLMSTEVLGRGKRVGEQDVEVRGGIGGVTVWE